MYEMSWERILNDLNNVLGELEDLVDYSYVITPNIQLALENKVKNVLKRLKSKKCAPLVMSKEHSKNAILIRS